MPARVQTQVRPVHGSPQDDPLGDKSQQRGQGQTELPQDSGKPDDDNNLAEIAAVESLTAKVRKWKAKRKDDFSNMRENMAFDSGLQWPGQKVRKDSRYICNWTKRVIKSIVAQLYAKNPTAEYQRRPRLDYQLFDGKLETLAPILQAASLMGLQSLPPQALALLADFSNGMRQRQLIDKVGKTLEILFQHSIDEVDGDNKDFLKRCKKAVRRACVTSVAFCMVSMVRDTDETILSSGPADTIANRAARAQRMLEKFQKGELDETKPGMYTFRSLLMSLASDVSGAMQAPDVNERIVYDFLPSTSIIPDDKLTDIKDFEGCDQIAIEFTLDIEDVKSLFDVASDFSPQKSADRMAGDKETNWISKPGAALKGGEKKQKCTVWRVLNKVDGSHCYVCDGYNKYLQPPEIMQPEIRGFWPIAVLSFNDVIYEEGAENSPYPPSHVQLIRDAQKEHNRLRNQLRKHRKANSPKWMVAKGTLTTADKDKIMASETNEVVELEGVLPGTDLKTVVQALPQMPVEPLVYDSGTTQQDVMLAVGDTAGTPPAQRGKHSATATQATIEAQENVTITQSDVEELDSFLSDIARIVGEMWLLDGSPDVVKRIAGPGAVFPTLPGTRMDFLNQIFLRVKAASSGRPNQAMEIRNWQILGPMLQRLGANPQALVRETVRRLGDNLEPEQFFPLQPPQPNNQQPAGGQHQPSEQPEHEPGRHQPPQQARPGPGQRQQQQAQSTPQRQAIVQRN